MSAPRKGVPTVFDPSYAGVGQKVGLEIWRVEALKVIKKPAGDKAYQGRLHEGDAYIILQTKQRNAALERHIYFWLGKESSQDEQGVAAYKTVELDESLGGEPVQHREVQEHESDEFLSLFPGGLRYEPGGVATGFKHVDRDAFSTRLLHVKGRRKIRVKEVPIDVSSMNQGDSFILDMGREIFVWNGTEASRLECSKAADVARDIRDQERGGNAKITVVAPPNDAVFFDKMGKKGKVKSASEGGDDDAHDHPAAANLTLHHISNASGKMTVTEIPLPDKKLKKEMLDTKDAFIVDTGHGIFVWVGKGADKEERAFATTTGTDFIKKKGYPNHTQVTRVVEGAETPLFKGLFESWPEPNAMLPGQVNANNKKKIVKKTFSAANLHEQRQAQKETLPDDGKGKLEVWRIEDFEMAPWPREKYGHFYGGDSYVTLYTYKKNDKEEYIIYFWQGLKSSQDEKGASAIHAVALDDKYGGAPVQVRVVQNKEPPHFLLVMQQFGGMVVHEGGRASGFKNVEDVDRYDTDGTQLFQIKGTTDWNTRAVQVAEKPDSLNSGDVFVLNTPGACYIWFGKGCNGDEREYGKKLAPAIKGKGETITVYEDQEPAAFWKALGWQGTGRPEYSRVKVDDNQEYRTPRLFQCSNNRGYFYVEEIFDFDQEDLIEEDVMLLDTYYELFIWVGKDANVEEKKKALETAKDFIKTDPTKRTEDDVCIMQIKQGFEPSNFKCHFLAWDDDKWNKLRAAAAASGNVDASPVSLSQALAEYSDDKKYTYEQLVSNDLPESVDKTRKEAYLTDADFEKYFKMSRQTFQSTPKWKQSQLKKAAKLF